MKQKTKKPLPTRLAGPAESPGFLLWKVSTPGSAVSAPP